MISLGAIPVHSLYRSPVNDRADTYRQTTNNAHIYTYWQFRLACMDCGRKPMQAAGTGENMENTVYTVCIHKNKHTFIITLTRLLSFKYV